MRIFLGIMGIVLLILVFFLGGTLAWIVTMREPYVESFRPDAPQYGQRGDYTVGVQSFTITGENRPLKGWVWYPTSGEQELANYSEFNGIFETSGRANWDAVPLSDDAPYPLVVFSHGSGASPLLSLFYVEHLASQGFVVIATEHPANTMVDRLLPAETYDNGVIDNYIYRPQDISRTIDYALDVLNTGVLSAIIDADKIAVSGHSFGGYTTFAAGGARLNFDALQTWCDENEGVTLGDLREEVALTSTNRDVLLGDGVCYLLDEQARLAEISRLDTVPTGAWDSFGDERIDAMIALAPWNAPIFGEDSLAEVTLPTLIIVGANDNTTKPERDARNFYEWLGSDDKILVEFALGDHSIFIDHCAPLLINFGSFAACSDLVWDLGRTHDITNHLATAFLQAQFYDDADAIMTLEVENIDFTGISVQRP